jgi:hypothetical protein
MAATGYHCALTPLPLRVPGLRVTRGQVIHLLPSHPSGLLSTRESARLIGANPGTIRKWRSLGYLAPQGLDEHGYPLHSAEAVRTAEKRVQERGIAASGVDPRRLRGVPAPPRKPRSPATSEAAA